MSNSPIGFFDSGVGGTSIYKAVHHVLPYEPTIYLADSANAPYGPKGKQWILERSIKNTELLLSKGCKLIIVACNTATTNAIKELRERYAVPFIGIEPAIKPASLNSKTKSIGILATKGTLSSELFQKSSLLYGNDVNITEQVGEGIVDLIESGKLNSSEMTTLLMAYMKPMLEANIDYLVLGCTHYPYLIPQLLKLLPKQVKIIDSGEAVARQTKLVLEQHELLIDNKLKPHQLFYTNGDVSLLKKLTSKNTEVKQLGF